MKKILSFITILSVIFCIMVFGTNITASAETSGYYTYTISNGEATITDVDTSFSGDITIPSTLGGYSVTKIGENAIERCNKLTGITIPDSVTTIESYAFNGCGKLKFVTIGNGVKTIGFRAFYSCECLESVTIGNSVETIYSEAFSLCISLKNVTIGNSVKVISSEAFSMCYNLKSIIIPDSVTSIGSSAFSFCSSLSDVTIPNSVTSIGYRAFYNCSSLKNVYITDLVQWCEISFGGEYSNPLMYANNLFLNHELVKNVVIPDKIKTISEYAFSFDSLESITIPSSVTSIGNSAFYNCRSLEDVYITDIANWCSISFGDEYANPLVYAERLYLNGREVTDLVIPDGVTNIPIRAFSCENLENVTIPNSVTSIGDSAFYGCSGITSITIPDSITSIGNRAFAYCGNLCSITIPDGVVSIGKEAFRGCYALNSISLASSVTGIGEYAFYDTRYYNLIENWNNGALYIDKHLIKVDNSLYLYEYEIEPGTIAIADYAFSGFESIGEITIPESVTNIGSYAFAYCSSLYSIVVPDGVTNIGSYAFAHCRSLDSIIISDSVTSIGENAFLDTHYYNSTNKWVNGSLFIGKHLIKVESSLYNCNIKPDTLVIADYAFSDCSNISFIVIPDSVVSVGVGAFYSCDSLRNITISEGVTNIGSYAFAHCGSLESITIPDSVTNIGSYALAYCENLYSIIIHDSVTSIGGYMVEGCYYFNDVWYAGSEIDKSNIAIDENNLVLKNAIWHFNFCSDEHTYTSDCDETCNECEWVRIYTEDHTFNNACDATCNDCELVRTIQHAYDNECDAECNICDDAREVPHMFYNDCDTTCNACGAIRTITHDYAVATCKEPKTCKVCGVKSGSKLSHKSDSGTVTKKATCTATGTKTYKCTLCKATINTDTIAKIAHKYDSGKVTKKATCKATGVKTYTCSVCKGTKTETIAKLTTHTYSNNCDKSCNVCGKTRTVGAHKYSNSCDTTCNECSATRKITHSYKITTTKATLSKNGKIVEKCSVCDKVLSTTTIKYAKTIKLSTTSYTYDGKAKAPTVTVKDSAGKTLKKNTDYTVSYASGRKNVGTYKVTVKMIGKYSGTKTLTFKINPAKTTVSKLTAGKKSITVAITKKSTQVTGYQIQYSTSKTFSKATTKTISSYKTTKYTLKSLSAKKTYYVRVRTYKTVGKTKYYSGWSTYKYVKTK